MTGRKIVKKYLLLLLAFAAFNALAANYKWTDAQGNVHYTDKQPPSGIESKTMASKPDPAPTSAAADSAAAKPVEAQNSAEDPRVQDVKAVPYLTEAGRRIYKDFLNHAGYRAFAVCPDGSFGTMYAEKQAGLDHMLADYKARNSGSGCRPYVINNAVVW
jgi:hypothetical protein